MSSSNRNGGYQLDNPLQPTGQRVVSGARVLARPGEVLDRGAVAIDGDTIVWVGRIGALPEEYSGWLREDHPQATIMPGMVETHAHLGGFAYQFQPDVPDPEIHDAAWHAFSHLTVARQLASLGVTTVQSLGARNYADVALREAISSHLVEGPRIVAAGAQLTTSGGHSWPTGGEVDSITEIRKKVRAHHKAGVDVIKVMATGGFGTFGSAPWNAQFTTDELKALVDESHRLGKLTAAHAHGTQGIRRALEAGIDYIAHATFISEDGVTRFDPELADALAAQGVFVDPCSPPSYPAVAGETITPRAKELYDHGVKIVIGHDIGAVLPPSGYVYGLEQLVESGLPIQEVLVAATSRGAAAVGLAGEVGVLAPGYQADLLVVAGDPTSDIGALRNLEEVIIAGRTFNRDVVPAFDPDQWRNREESDLRKRPGALEARTLWIDKQERASRHPLG